MRIMIFLESLNEDSLEKEIKYIQKNMHAKIDIFNDYEEAEYCMDIRQYDLVYLEYNKKYEKNYYNFFAYANKKEIVPNVFLLTEEDTKNNLIIKNFSEKYNFIKEEKKENFNLKKHLLSLNPEEENIIIRDNLKIDLKNKKIYILKQNEYQEVEFTKKFDFYVLLYFLRHYQSTININSLLDATCEEPEFTKDSIIESSISSIRKTFKDILNINPIKAFKKVGYRFSVTEI
jgi:DNA-binding response OmpR family regulator